MPCPYFEPVCSDPSPEFVNVRLPLIRFYTGRCHCLPHEAENVNGFCCNQGYASGTCPYFPKTEKNRAYRYSVLSRSSEQMQFLLIGEEEYFPAFTRKLHFSVGRNCLLETVEPVIKAQATAFCRNYLERCNAQLRQLGHD